jgi:uncharacterized LabA/DUF88 family protein
VVFIDGNNWYHSLREVGLVHVGRLDYGAVSRKLIGPLIEYLHNLPVRIDAQVFRDLMSIGHAHRNTVTVVEKAVDVHLAVDMVIMAERAEYDAAYLLSADGDFTPAVRAVRSLGQRVYAVSPARGAKLASEVNSYIRLSPDWFDDCYRPSAGDPRV